MQIVPAKINIKDDIVSAQGYAILDVKDRVEALRMDLLAENSNLCSSMSGDIKRYPRMNQSCGGSRSSGKVHNSLILYLRSAEILKGKFKVLSELACEQARIM